MEFFTAVIVILILMIIGKVAEFYLRKPYIEGITKDKYVFITGCDTGFGNKLTKQLDAKGVHVIATCLTEKGRTELNDVTSDRVTTLQMDVTNHESVVKAYEEVGNKLPHQSALWGVVNNAGINNTRGYIEWTRKEDYERVLGVNLFGTIDVTLTFLPLLKKSRGRLVNVVSCAGRFAPVPGGYTESKFALEAFSDIVRKQEKTYGHGFKTCIIEPGLFATDIAALSTVERSVAAAWNRLSNEEKEEFPESMMKNYVETKVKRLISLSSSDIGKVTYAMEHALFAQWPKKRYTVGWDAYLVWLPCAYMPSCLSDLVPI